MGKVFSFLVLLMSSFDLGLALSYVDLTYPINNETVFLPRHRRYQRHVDADGFQPNGVWFVTYSMTTSEHTGTHIDTPYHSYESGWTLEDIPGDNLINVPGVMIDMSHKVTSPNYAVNKIDLIEWEKVNGKIPERSVVLINTGWGEKWPKANFLGATANGGFQFPGLELCGARFLGGERNAIGVGIDTASIDAGFMKHMVAHQYLASRNIYVLENVANLHLLPARDFKLWVMPMKLDKDTTGSPIRLFAVLP